VVIFWGLVLTRGAGGVETACGCNGSPSQGVARKAEGARCGSRFTGGVRAVTEIFEV
jgi:hypothetical protein